MRVLGIDASLRSTGLGVVESDGSRLRAVEYGRIRNADRLLRSECLRRVAGGIEEMLTRTQPDAVAIEGVFAFKNVRTVVVLGEVRGAAILICTRAGLPVFEYPPRRVKQAVVGFGAADKQQVRQMVMQLLNLRAPPQEDASDALAIAITHLHAGGRQAVLAQTPL